MISRNVKIIICAGAMAALAGCQGALPDASGQGKAAPEQAASPSPAGETSTPAAIESLSDPAEIYTLLAGLYEKNLATQNAQEGWQHIDRVVTRQTGNLRGNRMEWWVNYNQGAGCPDVLQRIYSAEGEALETNILMEKDSPLRGKLKPAPAGADFQAKVIEVNETSCAGSPDGSYEQALLLLKEANPNVLASARAQIDGERLTLELRIRAGMEQVLTTTFDLATGFILNEKNQVYLLKDGSLDGESESTYTREFSETLPEGVAGLFAQALGE